jgi:hypothetical protein
MASLAKVMDENRGGRKGVKREQNSTYEGVRVGQ